jgi:hypothetical protein
MKRVAGHSVCINIKIIRTITMSSDSRIIELLSEMIIEQRVANQKLSALQEEMISQKHQQEITNIK